MDNADFESHPETITSPLMEKLGIQIISATPERCVATMPVSGNTQTAGVLHGGATAALAETAASIAASTHGARLSASKAAKSVKGGDPRPMIAVGTEVAISHLRPGLSGLVTATATAKHLGARRTVHAVEVADEDGRMVSVAQVSNMIIEGPR